MQYVVIAIIGLVVGLVVGRFLTGNNFGVKGDIVFAIVGAFAFAVGLRLSGIAPESGLGGSSVMAAVGAIAALLLRRVMGTV
ncbi:MAG: GlsB/YeaQ/YmgE family stress response membrane protein [Burkholderiales bacterium]